MALIRKVLRALKHLVLHGKLPPKSGWQLYKDYIRVHPTALIDPSAQVQLTNPPQPPRICLEIGERSHIFSNFFLLTSEAQIKIGARCQLGHSQFNCAKSIEVGDDVLMAWGITLMDHDAHSLKWEERKNDAARCLDDAQKNPADFIKNKDWSKVPSAPIRVAHRAWIGFNAIILKGVTIGEEAVIGAGSVVTRAVARKTVVGGNPATARREIEP